MNQEMRTKLEIPVISSIGMLQATAERIKLLEKAAAPLTTIPKAFGAISEFKALRDTLRPITAIGRAIPRIQSTPLSQTLQHINDITRPFAPIIRQMESLNRTITSWKPVVDTPALKAHRGHFEASEKARSVVESLPREIARHRQRVKEQIVADVVKGVGEYLEQALNQTGAKSRPYSFPTPPGARWEEVTIRFRDGHTVEVKVKQTMLVLSYVDLGLLDKRNGQPTQQWKLLERFAEEEGTLTWKSPGADWKNLKRKQLLSRHLQDFFGIPGGPIQGIAGGWVTRFRVSLDD